MTNFTAKIKTPREIPAVILGEAIQKAVNELFRIEGDPKPEVTLDDGRGTTVFSADHPLFNGDTAVSGVIVTNGFPTYPNGARAYYPRAAEATAQAAAEAAAKQVDPEALAKSAYEKARDAIRLTEVPERKIGFWDLEPSLKKAIDWVRRQMENEVKTELGPITAKKEEAPVADKHFQEPVAQPGRQHPFEGPEVFDDKAEPRTIGESYPYIQGLIESKRPQCSVPEGEGEWQLPQGDDHVGEDK